MNIEKNIEIPKRSEPVLIPYEALEIGDSFLAVNAKLQVVCNRNWKWGKKLGRKFIARQVDGGIRVWRTE